MKQRINLLQWYESGFLVGQ